MPTRARVVPADCATGAGDSVPGESGCAAVAYARLRRGCVHAVARRRLRARARLPEYELTRVVVSRGVVGRHCSVGTRVRARALVLVLRRRGAAARLDEEREEVRERERDRRECVCVSRERREYSTSAAFSDSFLFYQ